ncbi:putative disease resistance protein RGA4 [Beta vulgaris subsp. vulgaris]|uniref:putative disease resistance protein RGA4 n=1 Tax=Beta vulgaris subsp. vulgaris TaxID=3555 RepID=UPI0025476E70|nr:putative disease resistance protein RGA4 [Beta vulgaris subsp. vulgaris]
MGATRSVAETLLATLQTSMVNEMCSKWGFESELEDLKVTVSDTSKVLLDSEARQELDEETRMSIRKLKDAVYDADDLFDELLTVANQRKGRLRNDKLTEKVRDFFSVNNSLSITAHAMSQWVKNIMYQLGSLASSHTNFRFEADNQLTKEGRDEICSEFDVRNVVVGRENDMNAIIDLVLDSNLKDDVSFITIVGDRGLGKTTLAQLVYNDRRIRTEFPLRLWVDVLNGDRGKFEANAILGKILESSGRFYTDVDELLQLETPHQLGGKKYLLVLDDVWVEDYHKWVILRNFLMLGVGGSKIIISTYSEETTRVVGSEHTYELKGLSEENSWRLFKLVAFAKGIEHEGEPELVALGKKIVEECCGVPLVIKEVGSLLFGQDISKWRLFAKKELATFDDKEDDMIMETLKLSYHNLESPLKSCLSYCALFPDGFSIDKKKLVGLWMAQGYIVPLDGQSMEEAGEDYLSTLLQRCMLQCIERNEYGEVVSCKIHSRIHDAAFEFVTQETICVVGSIANNSLGDNIRHVHQVGCECSESCFPNKIKIRSYLHQIVDVSFPPLDKFLSSLMCLRALDLHDLNIKILPESIGKLIHLRYLDLSHNNLKRLPNSITKLYNLQTLNLDGCTNFQELPRDLGKLVNLMSLNIHDCHGMYIASGMDKLTCLHELTAFEVAGECFFEEDSSSEDDSSSSRKQLFGMLKDLKPLTNLRGSISISIPENYKNVDDDHSLDGSREGYLGGMEHLNDVSMSFRDDYCHEVSVTHEALLENLQPHPNLKGIETLALSWFDTYKVAYRTP